jgi:hypothetical protein
MGVHSAFVAAMNVRTSGAYKKTARAKCPVLTARTLH